MSKSLIDTPPGTLLRFGLRLPIWLYRLHLDRMLDDHFPMLIPQEEKAGCSAKRSSKW